LEDSDSDSEEYDTARLINDLKAKPTKEYNLNPEKANLSCGLKAINRTFKEDGGNEKQKEYSDESMEDFPSRRKSARFVLENDSDEEMDVDFQIMEFTK